MKGRDLGRKEDALKAALRRLDGLGLTRDEQAGIRSKLGLELELETTQGVVQDAER